MIRKLYEWLLWTRDVATFGQWVRFWDWIKLAHSSSDEASSKRLYGGLFILNCILSFDFAMKFDVAVGTWNTLFTAWFVMLLAGIGMIAFSVLEKIVTVITEFKIAKINAETK